MAKILKYFIQQMILKESIYVYCLVLWDSIEKVFLLMVLVKVFIQFKILSLLIHFVR